MRFRFYHTPYVVNNTDNHLIEHGDLVIVHPTGTSISRKSYIGVIRYINSNCILYGIQPEYNQYSATMNEYLYNRLEPVVWWKENKDVGSLQFQSLVALLNINPDRLRGLPGYNEFYNEKKRQLH